MTATLTLHVGEGKSLELPIDAVTETFAILGIRGSGKTNSAVVLAEEMLERGQQVVIIDPTNVWWGLKSSADGKSAGYPVVIMGGRKGDIPLAAGDGKAIADFVVDRRASVVLSTRHFESKADARRFVTDFCNRLYFRKGEQDDPTPIMVFIDECSKFIPQRMTGKDSDCGEAIQTLGRQGRSSGIGLGLIDQRGASVNKDVLSMVEVLCCHRTTSPQDRKSLTAWIEQHDADDRASQFLSDLATLPQGTAWIWSPGLLDVFKKVAVRKRRTFDSSRTPKAGERVIAPSVVAPVDLDELRASLAATIEKAKDDDPIALRNIIHRLNHELRGLRREHENVHVVGDAPILKAREEGFEAGCIASTNASLERLGPIREIIRNLADDIDVVIGSAGSELLKNGAPFAALAQSRASANAPAPAAPRINLIEPHVEGGFVNVRKDRAQGTSEAALQHAEYILAKLKGPEQRILDAIAWLNSVGIAEPDQSAVAFVAGYSENGGFKNPRSALNQKGLVQYKGDAIVLTAIGAAHANAPDANVTGEDLRARVLTRVPGPERKILAVLIAHWPDAVTNEDLAKAAGYALNGGFKNPRSRLRTLGLIEYPASGSCRARDILFPDSK